MCCVQLVMCCVVQLVFRLYPSQPASDDEDAVVSLIGDESATSVSTEAQAEPRATVTLGSITPAYLPGLRAGAELCLMMG